MTLDEAKQQVREMLALGDADAVFRAISKGQRAGRDLAGVRADAEAQRDSDFGMLRLALADLTGDAGYRL